MSRDSSREQPNAVDLDDHEVDELFSSDEPTGHPEAGADSAAIARLKSCDMAEFFGASGPIAGMLETYELRQSQVSMAEAVKRAILSSRHALIEAPTGTGKSIAYLVPALLSGKRVVVSTANKSLQSQLYLKDIPFLRKVMDQPIETVLVKGRSNFICLHKWAEEEPIRRQMAVYDREDEQVAHLRRWLTQTDTGDIDDLPFNLMPDLRPRVVSYPDDCLHDVCDYFSDCWVEQMRNRAAEAQLVITNHHLLLNALELGYGGQRILPPADIYIIDEAHQLEQIATAVYETTVTDYSVEQLLTRKIIRELLGDDAAEELSTQNMIAFQYVSHLSRENTYQLEDELDGIHRLGKRLEQVGQDLKQKAKTMADRGENRTLSSEEMREIRSHELAAEAVTSTARKLQTVATAKHDADFVRYVTRTFERRRVTMEIHAAPINPAKLLTQHLFHAVDNDVPVERTVICTSATLATGGQFDHLKRRCGIHTTGEEHVLPTVFDYPNQALLYQPALPSFDYRNADPYYDAVAAEIERLLEVSRGRALCLFTSWNGLEQVGQRLRNGESASIWPVRAQGDAPRDALLEWFRATANSVLLATRSFWEGVDIPGDDLSLVVLDKMPFPTPGDPLHSARMRLIEAAQESSFGQYMLPLMTLALKQGFGRLIRRTADRGVVAILDERLSSKGYGRQARNDLPPARFSRVFSDVHRFYQQALATDAEFALNVWVDPAAVGETLFWRWQLLRLHDGKADSDQGRLPNRSDPLDGIFNAAAAGLNNLHARIERAGQSAGQYQVELRCATALASSLTDSQTHPDRAAWDAARSRWKAVTIVAVADLPIDNNNSGL